MDTTKLIEALDLEIARLEHAKALLNGAPLKGKPKAGENNGADSPNETEGEKSDSSWPQFLLGWWMENNCDGCQVCASFTSSQTLSGGENCPTCIGTCTSDKKGHR